MHKTVIDAESTNRLNFRELLNYRDLLYVLAYRDFRVRYAQTALGFVWSLFQPLITLIIFTLVFGQALNVDTGGIPYVPFALCGICCWTYFAFLMTQSGSSLIASQSMIKKIYFPRLIIPLSKAVVGLIDYTIVFFFLVVVLIYHGIRPPSHVLFLPIFVLMTIISGLAMGIWLSALSVRYRDFQHIVPFLVQFGVYFSPVAFPPILIIERFPQWLSAVYYVNPMAGVIDGFRWSLLGGPSPHIYSFISFGVIMILLITGIIYFRKVERIMADII